MNNTDIAALSSAIVAATISIFMANGTYSWPSVITGLTLIVLLLSYSNKRKTKLHSLAFSIVLSFSALPIIGFILELNCYFKISDLLASYSCIANCNTFNKFNNITILKKLLIFENKAGINTNQGTFSSVMDFPIFVIWVILSFIFFIIDLIYQQILKK